MKIISKYKDYYDYLTGIYGVDELRILDRTKFEIPYYNNMVSFFICGNRIDSYYDDKLCKFYFGEDLKARFPILKERYMGWYTGEAGEDNVVLIDTPGHRVTPAYFVTIDDTSKLNEKANCPILCTSCNIQYLFPKLDETGISKVLPPHDIYVMLTEWLSKEKVILDTRTDEEKILSAGFDKKISFRNIK